MSFLSSGGSFFTTFSVLTDTFDDSAAALAAAAAVADVAEFGSGSCVACGFGGAAAGAAADAAADAAASVASALAIATVDFAVAASLAAAAAAAACSGSFRGRLAACACNIYAGGGAIEGERAGRPDAAGGGCWTGAGGGFGC